MTMGNVTLALSVIALLGAAYVGFRILRGTAVQAFIVSYDESEQYDPGTDSVSTSAVPIYRYTWQGETKEYRSRCAVFCTWLRRDSNTLWIGTDGRIYEKELAFGLLAMAVILFFIG